MENKKFLYIGLLCSLIAITCLTVSLIISFATSSKVWELGNLPLSSAEIFIVTFGIIIGISGILSGIFIIIWIIQSKR